MPLLFWQATVVPLITEGVLNAPRILLHLVLVCPHAFDAVTHISQPDSLGGKVPSVKVALGEVVVTVPPDCPLINVLGNTVQV